MPFSNDTSFSRGEGLHYMVLKSKGSRVSQDSHERMPWAPDYASFPGKGQHEDILAMGRHCERTPGKNSNTKVPSITAFRIVDYNYKLHLKL